jgi:cell fate (sporulation/competence/biofilm development) regulator YlbF (YheA/YmcA/DUF963 family)
MSYRQFLQPEVKEATLHLGQNLISTEPYLHYKRAEQALNDDPAATSLLNSLAQVQAQMRKAQAKMSVNPDDLMTLGDLQAQVQANPIISEYNTRKQELTVLLQETNTEISQLLGINFATIARHSSCC